MTFGSRVLHFAWAGARRAAAWPFRVAAARATLRALAQMDRHELADIGLSLCDLRDVAALPLDRDPTALLAARARGRRANAFAGPPTVWDGDWTDDRPHGSPRGNRPSPDLRSGSPRARVLRTG
jgi:uncharacterized protein YjiS (DUF1127 family)